MNIECPFCHALHRRAEALSHFFNLNPKFGMCCYQDKIFLPTLQHIPCDLFNLFTSNNSISNAFHKHILYYNNSLAITSVGKSTVNLGGGGPYSFVLHEELIY